MSPIYVTLTSNSDSSFELSNISLKESKRDDVDPNSNGLDYYVRKNEGKILWSSADCYCPILRELTFCVFVSQGDQQSYVSGSENQSYASGSDYTSGDESFLSSAEVLIFFKNSVHIH